MKESASGLFAKLGNLANNTLFYDSNRRRADIQTE